MTKSTLTLSQTLAVVIPMGFALDGSLYGNVVDGQFQGVDIGVKVSSRPSDERLLSMKFQRERVRRSFENLGPGDLRGIEELVENRSSSEYRANFTGLETRIRKFISYSRGWDGVDAKEIPKDAVVDSLNFLDHVKNRADYAQPDSAAPSPDGEIVLYWHRNNGYAEVNFAGNCSMTVCWGENGDDNEVIEEGFDVDFQPDQSRAWEALSDFLNNKLNV